MTGNAKEKFYYFKQLGMAMYVTALLKAFNPLPLTDALLKPSFF
jgi:hypothetical protein